MKRVVGWILASILYGAFLFYVMFFISFYISFQDPGGYDCKPTWTLGYKCVGPNGDTFGGH